MLAIKIDPIPEMVSPLVTPSTSRSSPVRTKGVTKRCKSTKEV